MRWWHLGDIEGDTLEDACREYIRQCEEKRAKLKKWYVHWDDDEIVIVKQLGRLCGRWDVEVVEAETIEEAIAKARANAATAGQSARAFRVGDKVRILKECIGWRTYNESDVGKHGDVTSVSGGCVRVNVMQNRTGLEAALEFKPDALEVV